MITCMFYLIFFVSNKLLNLIATIASRVISCLFSIADPDENAICRCLTVLSILRELVDVARRDVIFFIPFENNLNNQQYVPILFNKNYKFFLYARNKRMFLMIL